MHDMGYMFEEGKGCEQSYSVAVDWYRRAASQGHVSAKVNLGTLLANGKGVAQVDHE